MCARNADTMDELTVVGIDIGTDTFHLVGFDSQGRRVLRQKIKRSALNATFEGLPRCIVGMEAKVGPEQEWAWATRVGVDPSCVGQESWQWTAMLDARSHSVGG